MNYELRIMNYELRITNYEVPTCWWTCPQLVGGRVPNLLEDELKLKTKNSNEFDEKMLTNLQLKKPKKIL